MGFHHLTRPEDWPVLPTVWHQLKLRPYGFFIRNPDLGMHRQSTVKLPKPQ
jgi:primary-amine oxidase